METSDSGAAPQQEEDVDGETVINLALLDPPRFGWSAIGGVVDVLPPHERARRSSAREAHVKFIKGRERRARKKREASGSKFVSGTQQLTQQISRQGMMSASFQDAKPAARLKDPPSVSESSQNAQQNGPSGMEVAPSGSTASVAPSQGSESGIGTGAASSPNETSLIQQYVTNGMTMAAQGIAAGFASFMTNKDERSSSGGAASSVAASDGQSQSAAASKVSAASQASSHTNRESECNAGGPMEVDTSTTAAPTMPAAASVDGMVTATATASTSDTAKEATATGTSDNTAKGIIRVKALSDDGVLDMHTYHRGREGKEPRDDQTGELLCDVEPTDTNHGWEPPSLKISINVSFPLSDDTGEGDNGEPKSHVGNNVQDSGLRYTETVEWDLADPNTMTPMGFAAKVSEEFGLDAGQTFDLAQSIQKQINYFVQNKVSYKTPLTLLDAHGLERSGASAYSPEMRGPPQLYGSVVGETKAGMPIPQKLLQSTKPVRGKSSLSQDVSNVEPEYVLEAKRRLWEASVKDIAETSNGGLVGLLKEEHDTVCHACRKREDRTFNFACSTKVHALCPGHVQSMLGISVDGGDPPASECCPICALICNCRRCARKLSIAAANLKRYCIRKGVSPEEAPSDMKDLLDGAKDSENVQDRRASSTNRKGAAARDRSQRKKVPKVPVSDFPREVFAGQDMDPGTSDDYRTVFTAEGAFLRDDLPVSRDTGVVSSPHPNNGTVEDGNVDYCHACKKHGNLVCCDFCPRAFHADCITTEESDSMEGAWKCVACRKEKDSGDDDVVTGQSSLNLVCASFVDFNHSEGIDICVQILALIHETLLKLMDYDFGILFREPVDCKAIPAYRTIVKHPMDLGTIASRIVNGEYAQKYQENNRWDDVIVAVLRDIELVWHNCFLFNLEGSSIYRMAEVQRRKYLRIRMRSFDSLLSLEAKRSVDEYVALCELDRGKVARVPFPAADRRVVSGRHKITVGPPKKNSKIMAVLDPETGLLVKMYSSVKSASSAAIFLIGLGHPVECSSLSSEQTFRWNVTKMSKDPTLLLFGYRWLYLDELVGRKVKFSQSEGIDLSDPPFDVGIVEVKVGEELLAFPSIEEAVSWPDLPSDVSVAEVRRKLIETPAEEWTMIGGSSWRKFGQKQEPAKDATRSADDGESRSKNRFLIVDVSKQSFPSNISFVKEDLVTRRLLIGFENAASAHADWLKTRENSPICPVDEPTEFEYFKSYYLDGERNIDGIIWRSIRASGHACDSNAASTTAPESIDQSSEHKASASEKVDAPDSAVDNVTENMCTDNGVASGTGKDPAIQGNAQSVSNGTALGVAKTVEAPVSNKFGNMNGHRGALHVNMQPNGDLLRAKRSHANDALGSCRATKKAAICYT